MLKTLGSLLNPKVRWVKQESGIWSTLMNATGTHTTTVTNLGHHFAIAEHKMLYDPTIMRQFAIDAFGPASNKDWKFETTYFHCDLEMVNQGSTDVYITMYTVFPKQNIPAAGTEPPLADTTNVKTMTDHWAGGYRDMNVNPVLFGDTARNTYIYAQNSGTASDVSPTGTIAYCQAGQSPYDSTLFRKYFKIKRVKGIKLDRGATKKIQVMSRKPRIWNCADLNITTGSNVDKYFRNTMTYLLVLRGQIGTDTVVKDRPGYADVKVAFIHTHKIVGNALGQDGNAEYYDNAHIGAFTNAASIMYPDGAAAAGMEVDA